MKSLLILVVVLSACNFQRLDTTYAITSKSIEESKRNGVFRFELKPNHSVVHIGHHMKDTIQEIWVEHDGIHNQNGTVKIDSTSQIVVRLTSSPKKFDYALWLRQVIKDSGPRPIFKDFGMGDVSSAPYSNNQDEFLVIWNDSGVDVVTDSVFIY